jgi:Flp pilus assembly protein TadD
MKMINKIAVTGLGALLLGSSAFAQSLDDAKKAIDAEQYQKAKSMLKTLTNTQADKDENYFYLGWVYMKQDYTDSAKAAFTKGVNVNPKSALNYAGLGAVAHVEKDNTTAKRMQHHLRMLARPICCGLAEVP